MTGSVIQNGMHLALLTGDDRTAQSSTHRAILADCGAEAA
jgi:hypothetical protein